MSATMNTSENGTITFTPEKPTAAVVLLHGLGESSHIWADRIASLSQQLPHIKFILPSATSKPVTLHGGKSMPSWFDIPTADGIDEARSFATALIDSEVNAGIPHSRIVLGGFNQGGALSYFTAYQMTTALGGFLALSSTIPKPHAFAVSPAATSVPALICHGDADPTVVFSRAQSSVKTLQEAGVELDFRVYPGMEHSVTGEELEDVKVWLLKVLPENSAKLLTKAMSATMNINKDGTIIITSEKQTAAIAGVLALSCAIPKMHAFAVTPESKSVPALVCHGDADPMVIFPRAQASVEKLQDSGVDLDFRVYSGMRHTVNMQELADIRSWLQKVLPESSA